MLTDNGSVVYKNDSEFSNGSVANILDSLYEFLKEAELQHYFDHLNTKLKVRSVAQLKYVDETDLQTIGMTRPEMRRLKKYFAKEFPQTAMAKIKKRLSRTTSCRSTSVPRPEDLSNRMNSFSIRLNANGQSTSPMDSDDLVTIASVNNFSIDSNGTGDSSEWRQFGSKHLISHNQLIFGPLLQHNDVADLYKGNFRSGQVPIEVAVKVINKITLRNEFNDFVREMFTNCNLDHPNVIKLFGISLDDFSIKMVTELALCGSLADCLRGPESKIKYPITVLHGFVLQISDAMSYLEERRVIHGRLTGRNVLLFHDNQVKVTDAGLFRAQNSLEKNSSTSSRYWLSPEVTKGFRETLHSDVWAFGVLLWEMYSYYQHSPLSQMDESVSGQMDMRLPYLQQPDLCPVMIYQIIRICWTELPKDRPSFYQLSTQLIRLEPEQVVALVDGPDLVPPQRSDEANEPSDGSYSSLSDMQMLYYKSDDIIIVLDRSMNQYKELWRGCLLTGKSGYFKWSNMRAKGVNYPSNHDSKLPQKTKANQESPGGSLGSCGRSIGESFSKIRISRREEKKKVSIDMISGPQNDFRHVGHVGSNGDVFGDLTSLYATAAQKKGKLGKSGSVSLPSKTEYSKDVSVTNNLIPSTRLNTTAEDDSPPYATINKQSATPKCTRVKERPDKSLQKGNKTQPVPPIPPVRIHSEEEMTSNIYLDDFSINSNYPICNDSFSMFDELSKHWEMHSSKIESPTSETITGTSINDTAGFSSSPDRDSPSLNAGYSEVYDEPVRAQSICVSVNPPSDEPKPQCAKIERSNTFANSSSSTESNCAKSNIFHKFRVFGQKKQSKSTELSDGQKSPVYAKVNKPTKTKKHKEVKDNKKNIIGMPVLISGPVVTINENMDDSFMDCSSEVSSLQPSPRESVLCLTNGGLTDMSPSFNHQNGNMIANSRRKTSDSTTTSISPASSFASLTSTPASNILQGGAALRALRKGDCVFRATSAANVLNRRRPSVGQIQSDQHVSEGTMSKTRHPSLPFTSGIVKQTTSTEDRRNNFVTRTDNYEELDGVLDSSATTPVASELPDLPYIDLSFIKDVTQDKVNPCDDDDAYNSLHSGSVGSDTIESCGGVTRQSVLSNDGVEVHDKVSTNDTTSYYSSTRGGESNVTIHQIDFNGRSKNSKYSFNNANIFAMNCDNDEVAL